MCEIKNLDGFLEEQLKRKVLGYKLKPLTAAGENYGSIMQLLEVEVSGLNHSDESETFQLVAKTSITNPVLVQIFKPHLTFKKEVRFYTHIIPAIEELERTANIPEEEKIIAFIRCFGSRISLNPKAALADFDAILLLENIKILGYENVGRNIGFDVDEMREIVKQMAKIHSLCIALRRSQPDVFESDIRPFLEPIDSHGEAEATRIVNSVCRELKYVEGLDLELRAKLEHQLLSSKGWPRPTHHVSDTPYTTVVHRDMWSNNIMIRKDDAAVGRRFATKIFDFQIYYYESFAVDLIFCLCMSSSANALARDFRSLIEFYHSEFIKSMELVNCPIEEYSFESMWHEFQEKAATELVRIFFISKFALADDSQVSDTDTFDADKILKKDSPPDAVLKRWKLVIEQFVENGLL